MSDTRLAVAGLLVVLVAGGAAVWALTDRGPAAPPPVADGPPIPVRDDGPYRPLDYQLSTADAIKMFEGRVAADPVAYQNLLHLSGLYVRKARAEHDHAAYAKADDALRRVLEMIPNHESARVGRAMLQAARHRFTDALAQANELLKERPNSVEAKTVAADAHLELGHYADADRLYAELAAGGQSPPGLLARKARLAELRGDPAGAVALLGQAVAARSVPDPDDPRAWYRMRKGEVLLSMGRPAEAAAELTAALADQPGYPAALALRGRAWMAEGKFREAVRDLEAAAKAAPDIPTMAALADVYRAGGQPGLAEVHEAAVEAADQGKPEYARELALYYADRRKKPERAVELARVDFALRQDIYSHDVLGWALARAGKPAEAEPHTVEALKLGTKDATLLLHAAVVQQQLGRPDRVKELLARATAANPHLSPPLAAEVKELAGKSHP